MTFARSGSPANRPDRGIVGICLAAAATLTVLPFVAALIAWRKGWMPTSDWASVVVRSYDTLSANPPLVGIYSSATATASGSRAVYHPGPLQEWLLAAPIHLFAPSTVGILAGSALLVSSCIATVLLVAWRRGGRRSLCLGIVMMAVFILATGPAMLREPLHTPLATYAMIAFLACAWAVLDGDDWFWPVAVFFLSLAGQAQVAFFVPGVVVLIVVAIRRIAISARQRRDDTSPRPGSGHSRRVAGVTVLVALICWVAPIYDQLFGSGNLWALFVTGRSGPAIGPSWALSELAKTLAVPPSWIDHDQRLSVTVVGGTHVIWQTSGVEWVTSAFVLVGLVWGLWRAARCHRRSRIALGTVAASSLLGCFLAASLMPNEPFGILGHREIWRSAGMFTWWFLALTLADVIRAAVPQVRTVAQTWGTRIATAVAVVAVIVTSVQTVSRASPARDTGSIGFGGVEAFTATATPLCATGPIAVQPTKLVDAPTALGLIAMLTLRGCEVHAVGLDQILPGPIHRATGSEPLKLTIDGFDNPPPGCHLAATYDPAHPPSRYRSFSSALDRLQRDGPSFLFVCPRSEPTGS